MPRTPTARHTGALWLIALIVFMAGGRLCATKRQPPRSPPTGAELRRAQERVATTFAAELANAPSRTSRVLLAERLLATAEETEQLADAWVLLHQAHTLAISAGSYPLAKRCLTAQARRFEIQVAPAQVEAFGKIARESASISDRSDLQAAAADLMRQSLQAVNPDAALEVCSALDDYADRVRAAALQGLTKSCRSQLKDAQRLKAQIDTDDGRGRYLCFAAGQWQQGLALLSRGATTPQLRRIADLEINIRTGAQPATQLADAWWEFSEQQTGLVRESSRRHAASWYRFAAPRLQGLQQARAVQVQELASRKSLLFSGDRMAASVNLLSLITPADIIDKSWQLTDGHLVSTARDRTAVRVPWQPGSEYDLTLTVRRRSGHSFLMVGLCRPRSQFTVILNAPDGDQFVSGPSLFDGRGLKGNPLTVRHGPLFPEGGLVRIKCQVRQTSLSVQVGQQTVTTFQGNMDRLTIGPFWRIRNVSTLFLRSEFSEFEIESIQLRPVTGIGQEQRP